MNREEAEKLLSRPDISCDRLLEITRFGPIGFAKEATEVLLTRPDTPCEHLEFIFLHGYWEYRDRAAETILARPDAYKGCLRGIITNSKPSNEMKLRAASKLMDHPDVDSNDTDLIFHFCPKDEKYRATKGD